VRVVKKPLSTDVPMALSSGLKKLGHPVPLSNFASDEKSGSYDARS
jgi:hypothetical protein